MTEPKSTWHQWCGIFCICTLVVFALLVISAGRVSADLKADIGYTELSAELGASLPTGSSVAITQVEAPSSGNWMPNAADSQFTGKTIVDKSGEATGTSSHATTVGRYFYGNTSGLAIGVTDIDLYPMYTDVTSNYWIGSGYLNAGVTLGGNPIQPAYLLSLDPEERILASPSRVSNHSWVASASDISGMLRRVDFTAEADQFIHVVAVNNGSSPYPLLSGAFNVVTVGRTDGSHPSGTMTTDDDYTGARVCPLLVAPIDKTSYTTPVVASAAALLVQAGRDTDQGNDPFQTYTTDRSGRTIVNAEQATTIKAALLAGAQRMTYNTSTTAQIIDFRYQPANCSDNGLDIRYGAGQLDIYNSFWIIAAGEQNSAEDDSALQGAIDRQGFDLDPQFGGMSDSNSVGTYQFTAGPEDRRLYICLVWHMNIDGGTWYNFDQTATLYDLNLQLYDTTCASDRLIDASEDQLNNTENLWVPIVPGRSYRLEVSRADGQDPFLWEYALAWRMTTPPDSDNDGIEDEWEVQFGMDYTDPLDGTQDSDADGLAAADEYLNGTDPDVADTDGDGAKDGAEIVAGSDPLDPDDLPAPSVDVGTAGIIPAMLLLLGVAGYRIVGALGYK